MSDQETWVVVTKKEKEPAALVKVKVGLKAFGEGFLDGITDPGAVTVSGVLGLAHGLKYGGSVKRGVKGTLASAVAFGLIGGTKKAIYNLKHCLIMDQDE